MVILLLASVLPQHLSKGEDRDVDRLICLLWLSPRDVLSPDVKVRGLRNLLILGVVMRLPLRNFNLNNSPEHLLLFAKTVSDSIAMIRREQRMLVHMLHLVISKFFIHM